MTPRHRSLLRASLLPLLVAVGCLPYTVGSTAQTVPEGERKSSTTAGFVLGGAGPFDDTTGTVGASSNYLVSDQELRFGLSDRSDIGLRVTSASGLVVNYKRRHFGAANPDSAGFATMWGAGIVNWAQHGIAEATMLYSGRRNGSAIPYGGVRAFATFPLDEGALHDKPTVGAFFGVRLGRGDVAFTPELGVFYDESALQIRNRNFVIVPSITLTGISFLPRIFR